jgi:hypothetical protein
MAQHLLSPFGLARFMSKRRIVIVAVSLAVVVAILGVSEAVRGPRSMFAGFDRKMQRHYEAIAMGSSERSAIEALGEPQSKGVTFALPQRQGFEHYFDAAQRSTAVEYLLWINGMNWYYCIGFDGSGKAVVKGEGHS